VKYDDLHAAFSVGLVNFIKALKKGKGILTICGFFVVIFQEVGTIPQWCYSCRDF